MSFSFAAGLAAKKKPATSTRRVLLHSGGMFMPERLGNSNSRCQACDDLIGVSAPKMRRQVQRQRRRFIRAWGNAPGIRWILGPSAVSATHSGGDLNRAFSA